MRKQTKNLLIALLLLPWIVGFTIYGRDLVEVIDIDTAPELESVANLGAIFNEYADDTTYTAFRTTIGIGEVDTDPDVTEEGELSHDTDGANVANDFIIRAFDGVIQFPVASRNIPFQHTFNAAGAVTDDPVWYNDTGMTFNIEYIIVNCDSNTVIITLDEYTSFTNITHLEEIDSLAVNSAGTGIYFTSACASGCEEVADINHKVIETGHGIFAAYSGAGVGTILIRGYFDANVD